MALYSPRAKLCLQVRIPCILGDGIRHFSAQRLLQACGVMEQAEQYPEVRIYLNAANDFLSNIINKTKLPVPVDVSLVSKGWDILPS